MSQVPVVQQPLAVTHRDNQDEVIEPEHKILDMALETLESAPTAPVGDSGFGKRLHEFLTKWKVFPLLTVINGAVVMLLVMRLLRGTPESCSTKSQHHMDEVRSFYLICFVGVMVNIMEAALYFATDGKGCCSCGDCVCCDCVCCPCLDCGDQCGWRTRCCFDLIHCFFCTCTECKHCRFFDCRNCFYYNIHNPFIGFKTVLVSLVYVIWQFLFRSAAKEFSKDKACYEDLVGGNDILLILSATVVVKIALKAILGLVLLVEAIKNRVQVRRNRSQESDPKVCV